MKVTERAYGLDLVPAETWIKVGNGENKTKTSYLSCLDDKKQQMAKKEEIFGYYRREPEKREDGWMEIELGEFETGREGNEEVVMSLTEVKGYQLKGGIRERSDAFPEPRENMSSSRWNRTIYVGNLPGDIRMREVEDLFYKYGPIVDIDLKIPPRPPGYAFVEFEDPRDADDAIYGRDGYDFDGCRLRVEIAHGGRRGSSSVDRHSSSYSGSRAPSRRSDYRVLVTGLPPSASWQDLKDHMRKAGDVCFSEVFRDRGGMSGVVDYSNYDDMKYAIRKLDDSEFRNAFSRAYIRVREYESRSVSRSPYYSRSRSRSRGRSYSYSSRSVSPARSSRSPTPYSSISRYGYLHLYHYNICLHGVLVFLLIELLLQQKYFCCFFLQKIEFI
ncbi:unnamed protein product [Brassica rapa subsp. narinosa]